MIHFCASDNIYSAQYGDMQKVAMHKMRQFLQSMAQSGQNERTLTNKIKVKGLGQAFFPKGLRVTRGQSHLVAVRRQRNLFADG